MITKRKIMSRVAIVIRCMIIAVCLTTAFPDAVSANNQIAVFSADWVMMTPDGNVLSTSRLYVTPEAYRMDGLPMGGGQHGLSSNITFLGLHRQKREYVFNHDRKLVFESEMDETSTMEMFNIFDNVDSEVVLGLDTGARENRCKEGLCVAAAKGARPPPGVCLFTQKPHRDAQACELFKLLCVQSHKSLAFQ